MSETDVRLRELCAEEYPRLVGALRLSCGRDIFLAEELAQEALARLCRDWQSVQGGPSARAWLYRVAFNLARSYWRRHAVRRRVEARLRSDGIVTDHADAAADRGDVRHALAQLSQRERSVIVLRHFLELPVREAALALDSSEQAVRSLNHRALNKLRIALSDEPVTTEATP